MTDLAGSRVLVIEDEPMVAILIEDILVDAGCEVLGPHLTFESGLRAARAASVDVAVLDVNLGGRESYPIGEALSERGIPFVLTSGYGEQAAPPEHRDWPVCAKPFDGKQLTHILLSLRRS